MTKAKIISAPEPSEIKENLQKTSAKLLKPLISLVNLGLIFRPKSYTPILAVLLVIAAFLLGVLITKVDYLEKGQSTVVTDNIASGNDNPQSPGQKVDVGTGHLPALGDKNAKVKIVEFADFRCPFCQSLYKNAQKQIIEEYVNSGKAVFYFRHFQFLGPASVVAGNAAECANEQGKFWEIHDYLYDNQPPESDTSMYTTQNLTQVAGTLGMNTSQFKSCMDSNKYSSNLDKDMSEGQAAGVSGTPTMFVNGRSIVGAEPYESIKPIIDQALEE